MVVVGKAVFVPHHLTVQFVNQVIDRCVKIFVGAFRKQIAALDMNIAFSALTLVFFFLLFDGEQHFDIHHLIEMSSDSV
jgi:hypothetical protein